jgi:hypothetical protein
VRHVVIHVLTVVVTGLSIFPATAVAQTEHRRGELGAQLGVRRLDGDITPDGNSGVNFTWGIEGAWALGDKWAIFVDANRSAHDSIEICEGAEYCSALTPDVTVKVVTFGMERRLKAGPKGGQWLLGLGTGMMDLDWNGVQVHHGIVSLNFSRRMPLGPGVARVTVRTETGFSGRTDNQLVGSFDHVRMTHVVVLVGWGFGVGARR